MPAGSVLSTGESALNQASALSSQSSHSSFELFYYTNKVNHDN